MKTGWVQIRIERGHGCLKTGVEIRIHPRLHSTVHRAWQAAFDPLEKPRPNRFAMERSYQILFICSGNYYRSRFAEESFNHHAIENGWKARAFSKGFRPSPERNPGSMSPYALEGLRERGIAPLNAKRMPEELSEGDFVGFPRVIAMSDSEHRPMMRERFPAYETTIDFFLVEDLHLEPSSVALPRLEASLRALFAEHWS